MTATQTQRFAPSTDSLGCQRVIVGVDDTPHSDLAVAWAQREADARGVPLRTICVAGGRADEALIAAGAQAGLIVVGHRHLNVVQRMVARSVSAPVAAHAPCPVVVVNGPADRDDPDTAVVAGVAGKPGDADILQFAFEYAARHSAPVDIVLCSDRDVVEGSQASAPMPEAAELALARTVNEWRVRFPDVPVYTAVVRNDPVAGLAAMTAGQRILVVGRPRRRFACGAGRFSVTHGVLRRARCPIAVVPTR